MSVRVLSHHNTNTTHNINKLLTDPLYLQIMDVLGREELTFPELSEILRRDEEALSRDLQELTAAGAVAQHFKHHQVTYTLARQDFRQTIQILYEIWARRVRAAEERS